MYNDIGGVNMKYTKYNKEKNIFEWDTENIDDALQKLGLLEAFEEQKAISLIEIFSLNLPDESFDLTRVSYDGYTFDFKRRTVYQTDHEDQLPITNREFCLLEYLIMNQGKDISREELVENIWTNSVKQIRVVDDTIRRIRSKLPNLKIISLYGAGYRFR